MFKNRRCVSIFTKTHEVGCLQCVHFMHYHCINFFKYWFCRSKLVFEIWRPGCMFLIEKESLYLTLVCAGPCYIEVIVFFSVKICSVYSELYKVYLTDFCVYSINMMHSGNIFIEICSEKLCGEFSFD